MTDTEAPLQGSTICYVSTEAFGGVWRTYKQAQTVAEAGARVVVAGYEGMVPAKLSQPPFEVALVDSPFRESKNPLRPVRIATNLTVNRWMNDGLTKPRSPESLRRRRRPLIDAVIASGADIVQAVDLPSLDSAHEAATRMGAKLVYASHELWAGFVRNPDLHLPPELVRCLLTAEKTIAPRADLVTAVSAPMAQRMAALYDMALPLVLLNSPPARVDMARPVSDPVRLVFHGGLSTDRNLVGLVEAMVGLRGRATLDIHGSSRTQDSSVLDNVIDDLNLTGTVRLHGHFDYEDVIGMLSGYDVGVMTAKSIEENFEIALPNKLFDCICAGLAVAMSDAPAIRQIIEESGSGITLDPSTPETITRDLGALIDDPERIMGMKRAAVAASARYWWPEQGRKLVEALEGILRSN